MLSLSVKEGSLFVLFCFVLFVLMRSIEPGCFRPHACWSLWKALEDASDCMLGSLWKALVEEEYEGCIIDLVSWCLDLRCRSVF